jgi:G3E family GTPase
MTTQALFDLFPSRTAGPFGRRVKRARGVRIPVIVLTGFLGAGKTTLLQRLLRTPEGAGTAVVINEFGQAGIDDALVRSSAEETVLLGNGCLCCSMRSDLEATLRRLVADRQFGRVPPFRRVVIETSGLADPAPILQTFITDRALGGEFHVEGVIALVDAVTGAATLDWSVEARRQIILADRLIVTKTDLAGAAVAALQERLRRLNRHATIAIGIGGDIDPAFLLEASEQADESHGFLAETTHSDNVTSFVITFAAPIAWPAFARTMETLSALRGPDLLRVKGLLDVKGCRGPVVVQFVQHLAHPPVELQAWPDNIQASRLVFITRGIRQRQVRDLFSAVAALDEGVTNTP